MEILEAFDATGSLGVAAEPFGSGDETVAEIVRVTQNSRLMSHANGTSTMNGARHERGELALAREARALGGSDAERREQHERGEREVGALRQQTRRHDEREDGR